MTAGATNHRSTAQQLAEFLAVVTSAEDATAAARDGVERMAESVEAEVGALVRAGAVQTAIGFGGGGAPLEGLVAVIDREASKLEVPGVGMCPAVAVPIGDGDVVLARAGGEGFDATEVSLLRGMARVLSLALDMIHAFDSLRESEQFALSALDNASEAYVAFDSAGHITAWNRQAQALFGWSAEEVVGRDLVELLVPPARRAAFRAEVASLSLDDVGPPRREATAINRDGVELPVEAGLWTTWRAGARVNHAFFHDVSERKAAEEVMAHQALHDALTGLPNRELFIDRRGIL